jgi:glycosyltransferase involved in cell wall biosynthesis
MKIAIATVQVPFISGGGEAMTDGLCTGLRLAGHQVEVISIPFRFSPATAVMANMIEWQQQNFERFDCGQIDRVIALKFPAYALSHSHKTVWLMHQHRSVYELYDTPYGEASTSAESRMLREKVMAMDKDALSSAHAVFTISKTVSQRLHHYNGVNSISLYQPPPHAEHYRPGPAFPYIFVPSRLETLKRQELLVRAMKNVASPLYAVIAGEGGQAEYLRRLAETEGVQHRVKFVGRVDQETHRRFYSNAFAVFFCPYAEDYGFVTLEAMLSAKPVITCKDSGGPTEFVIDGETGLIIEPESQSVVDAINKLWKDRTHATDLGRNGLHRYHKLDICWDNVVNKLLGSNE